MASSLLSKLKKGLFMTHTEILEKVGDALTRSGPVDAGDFDRLEEALIAADLGVELAIEITEGLRKKSLSGAIESSADLLPALKASLLDRLPANAPAVSSSPRLTLLVGVNGSGKTTTTAKLAWRLGQQGRSVVLGAADTFRAAAVEQLAVWAERADVPLIAQGTGADPAAVVFDAIASAKAKGIDEIIIDTAGRLHTHGNLMRELDKIRRVAGRELEGAPHEVLLVLDATTGGNALIQARQFLESAGVTGVVLTKLDGTAKGGVVISIAVELGLPVCWIGVGEGIDDLLPFDRDDFVEALLSPA